MKVFVAGASGAIGRPLITELIRQGHTVTAMTRSQPAGQSLTALGATVALVDAFDAAALEQAVQRSAAEVIFDELTSLPKNPSEIAAALPGVVAAQTELPVIGVPLRSSMSVLDGMDALLSIVQMPPGVPVATVGVDNAKNAAVLAARILALL